MPSRADLAKIHIALKELKLTDEVYRDILWMKFKQESSKDLTDYQAAELLAHFKSLGWRPRRTNKGRPLAQGNQARKIRAMWIELHKRGVVRDSSERALASFARRITGVHALQWLTPEQAGSVIEALKSWEKRTAGDLNGT